MKRLTLTRTLPLTLLTLLTLLLTLLLTPPNAHAGDQLEPHELIERAEGVARVKVDLKGGGAALIGWLAPPDSAHDTPLAPPERLTPCAPTAALLKGWVERYPTRAQERRVWQAALKRGHYTALLALRRVEGEWRATCETEAIGSQHWEEHPLHSLWDNALRAALSAREALVILRAPAPRVEVEGWHLSALSVTRGAPSRGCGGSSGCGGGPGDPDEPISAVSVALTSAWRDTAEGATAATLAWRALAAHSLGGVRALARPEGEFPTCEVVWTRSVTPAGAQGEARSTLRLSRGEGSPLSCLPPPLSAHAAALRALLGAEAPALPPLAAVYLTGPLSLSLDAGWGAEVARAHLRRGRVEAGVSARAAYLSALGASGVWRGWRAAFEALGVRVSRLEPEKDGPSCAALGLKVDREARALLAAQVCDALVYAVSFERL